MSGTTRRPGALKLIGHSRLALHRAFHHLVLEVRDDGGFLANNCKLMRVIRRSRHPDDPDHPDGADADFRAVRVHARKPKPKNPRSKTPGVATADSDPDPPALVAIFGPFDRDVVIIPECDRRAASIPVAYRASLRSSNAADGGRRARLFLGIALVALAPALSEWTAAYYGAGAMLFVTVLALVLLRRAARLAPGGRSARGVASVLAAAAAFDGSSEHLARFLEAYVALCLRPKATAARAASSETPTRRGLPVALAATAATLAGAGAGFWAVRRWMIDPDTGGVEPTVAAPRASRVARWGRYCYSSPRWTRRAEYFARAPPRRGRRRSRSARREDARRRFENDSPRDDRDATNTPVRSERSAEEIDSEDFESRNRRGRGGRRGGTRWASARRRRREEDRRLGPFGRFRPVGRFGPVGRRARTVASVRILTPGVVVLEDGVGLASSSSRVGAGDDGPGAEHAPRRSPRRRAGRGRDARRIEIAVVGESRAGFVVAVAVRRARFGSVDATREPGFPRQRRGLASVSIRAPGEGDGVAAATSAGAAAASRGRFLTEVEFHELGRETTDRGLDELCGTPEFAKWMRRRARKVRLEREDDDDDDA